MASMKRFQSRFGANEASRKGLMLVEAALTLPLLLLLVFGVMEYSWAFLNFQHVTNAARQGARVAARADSMSADVTREVQAVLNSQGITVYTLAISPGDVSALDPGDPITVTVTVPYANLSLTGFSLLPLPGNLRSSITMAKEGS